ncbi:MAG: hypothetical protein JXX29_20360 [Deltaproteobacteria bacterium]|nr:hypothetical protein [Deltaproteobacteria bacterium]MBN2674047.1 hypothetical protein [Deltaproteobacteria bacterium]
MLKEESYRSWKEFEMSERRRVATFQLSVDNLARDLYLELEREEQEDAEVTELNFDY